MSMEEWPDDHLDELFRKSAEEHDVSFNADDWTDMNRRLAEHDRQQVYKRLLRWSGVGLLLLLLGGLTWFAYEGPRNLPPAPTAAIAPAVAVAENQPTEKRIPVRPAGQPGQTNTSMVTKATPAPMATKTAAVRVIPREKSANRLVENNVPVPAVARGAVDSLVSTGQPTRTYRLSGTKKAAKLPTAPAGLRRLGRENPGAGRKAAGPVIDTEAMTRIPQPIGTLPPRQMANLPEQTTRLSELDVVAGQDRWLPTLTPASSQSSVVQQVRSLPEPTLTLADVPAVRVVRPAVMAPLRRLSVLLFASPDLSAIGLKNFERPGSNAGLSVQYQLTDRLSVYTGAMLSMKRYQTYSDDYVWPASWTWTVWPNEIIGTCRMIDVPVNVRYDWLLRPRPNGMGPTRWFASTGLTSYFIQRETYEYEYTNPNDPNIQGRGWDNQRAGRPGGSFGFSNLNLSVGYERPITRRLSWQVEPFMKVPLQQVGFFRVKLLSTGAFAGLRYRL